MKSKFTATALLLVLTLALTLACSGGDPTPAPKTDRTQQELLDTIDRMGEEIESLQQQMEESRRTRSTEEASASEGQTARGSEGTLLNQSQGEMRTGRMPGDEGRTDFNLGI